jgi:hypothetical protein
MAAPALFYGICGGTGKLAFKDERALAVCREPPQIP